MADAAFGYALIAVAAIALAAAVVIAIKGPRIARAAWIVTAIGVVIAFTLAALVDDLVYRQTNLVLAALLACFALVVLTLPTLWVTRKRGATR